MSNVLAFPQMARVAPQNTSVRLIEGFAQYRRNITDVFWLKENAELLGILAVTGQDLPTGALTPLETFYDEIEERIEFFPQYYRFLISLCLDLEDLGMPGDKGERICAWAARQRLAEAELSDLQRSEARRLLARRDAAAPVGEGDLGARLIAFIERSETFAMPNRKAAYELTHIVFYLSDYGRYPLDLSPQALLSLEFAGLLAYLDQNMDLLAEICLALEFARMSPSPIWTEAVVRCHENVVISEQQAQHHDAYHEYLVTGWAAAIFASRGFDQPVPEGAPHFALRDSTRSTLMSLSTCLNDLGKNRTPDWGYMRGHVLSYLGQDGHDVLLGAEQSTDKFDQFFEGFARAARV